MRGDVVGPVFGLVAVGAGEGQRKGLSYSLDVGRDGFEGGIDTLKVMSLTGDPPGHGLA